MRGDEHIWTRLQEADIAVRATRGSTSRRHLSDIVSIGMTHPSDERWNTPLSARGASAGFSRFTASGLVGQANTTHRQLLQAWSETPGAQCAHSRLLARYLGRHTSFEGDNYSRQRIRLECPRRVEEKGRTAGCDCVRQNRHATLPRRALSARSSWHLREKVAYCCEMNRAPPPRGSVFGMAKRGYHVHVGTLCGQTR